MSEQASLLSVQDLTKHFDGKGGLFSRKRNAVRALNGVSFEVGEGETLGIVGESGCGKSTLGRCVLRLEEPTSGSIRFEGRDLIALSDPREMRNLRRHLQIIFQDPFASLNPRKSVGSIIGEGLRVHGLLSPQERLDRVRELMELVGLRPEHVDRFPHQFSGGQRQRVCIARALSLSPKLIVADEAVSALDVSVQAQILNLLVSLQKRLGLSFLFISHDLGVVRHVSDRVGVMYFGKLVELAPSSALYKTPAHPYTEALLAAVPRARVRASTNRTILEGEVPSLSSSVQGCPFHTRCRYRQDRCKTDPPALSRIGPDHFVGCHYPFSPADRNLSSPHSSDT